MAEKLAATDEATGIVVRAARSDEELFERLAALTRDLPPDTELHRMLLNLDDPAHDEPSKDRYVALVSAGVVEEGLKVAIARHLGLQVTDVVFEKKTLANFDQRIRKARALGLVTAEEETELNRLRRIRNAFAHAVSTVSFGTPEIAELTKRLYHHPVSDWSGYFAPAFAPRHQFAIVCGEFYANFIREQPVAPRGKTAST